MGQQTRATLKSYFETGDTPTEAQFIDLIDSLFGLLEDDSDDIQEGSSNLFLVASERTKIAATNIIESGTFDTGALSAGVPKNVVHSLDLLTGSVILQARDFADTKSVQVSALAESDANSVDITSNVDIAGGLKIKVIGVKN